jgi:pilus assembly protein CpaF
MSAFLFDAVRGRAAVLVSGGTSVGKTTLLNALSEAIGDHERVVTIEDSYELRLSAPFVISMQTKEAGNSDDLVTIDQEFLVRSSLRMRPDRVIVGEIRDPAAAEVMLQAAMSGHEGTMTTIHADNVEQALNWRLTNLVRRGDVSTPLDVVRWQISEAFDLAVQGTRSREGRRYISEISEVVGELRDGMIVHNPLFRGHCEFGEAPVFERVGSLTPDGRLVQRITDAGIDPARWLAD